MSGCSDEILQSTINIEETVIRQGETDQSPGIDPIVRATAPSLAGLAFGICRLAATPGSLAQMIVEDQR
jgi:hypothetical protein